MKRFAAYVLGPMAVAPLAYLFFFFWWIFRCGTAVEGGYCPSAEDIYSWHVAAVILTFSLLLVFLRLLRRMQIPGSKKQFWILVLLLGGPLSFPAFWYVFVLRKQEAAV